MSGRAPGCAGRALLHPLSWVSPSPADLEGGMPGLGPSVTIPRARDTERLAGGSRSRVPPDGGAMLTLLRLPF
jgi:hypothetical protein